MQASDIFGIQLDVVLQRSVFDEYATEYFHLLTTDDKSQITYHMHLLDHLWLNSNSNQNHSDKPNQYTADQV